MLAQAMPMHIDDDIIPLLFGCVVAGVIVLLALFRTVRAIAVARAAEHSRREIAAYIAEGSMTAEEGAALLAAGRPTHRRCG